MISSITPREGTRVARILLADSIRVDELPSPQVVPLFGANGIGKSTLIRALARGDGDLELATDGRRTAVWTYVNGTQNMADDRNIRRDIFNNPDLDDIMAFLGGRGLSEGQAIMYSLYDLVRALDPTSRSGSIYDGGGDALVLLDEFDSGLSLDHLDWVLRRIRHGTRAHPELQVILSFNNPYVLRHFPDVMSMYDGHALHLGTEEEMYRELKARSRELRLRRGSMETGGFKVDGHRHGRR